MKRKLFALFAVAALLLGMSSCVKEDNASSGQEETVVKPEQLKQGVWTEYDDALEASGKYTIEQLAAMPAVGMKIEGDKASFFLYTADEVDDPAEGKISYDKTTGKGTIAFPTIKDSPLSDQNVSFSMITDDAMQFELTYEGKKTTATFAWLCENTDNWGYEATNIEWRELMDAYKLIGEDWGPDPSIDWGDLAEPLTWDETPQAKANKRAVGAILEGVTAGLDMFASIFEEDPNEVINAKLDALLGKVDKALANQQVMINKLNEVNARLIAIAEKMNQQETLNKFNERNKDFYNKLEAQNNAYFNSAFKLYDANKNNLSADQRAKLGDYGKEWVGGNREFINLTWEYIKYLTTVQHSTYGVGMDKIYDALTFAKYPWEHMGINDRKNYRAYDIAMIAKSLFMIGLYAQYGGLSDVAKEGIYNNYDTYRKQLKEFCMFNVSNPDKFLVCQIPGAHFVMHKEIQKYNFCGNNNECPHPNVYGGSNALYRPQWQEAGNIKIENPEELKSKLLRIKEAFALYDYYKGGATNLDWANMLVKEGGAVYAKNPTTSNDYYKRLILFNPDDKSNGASLLDNGATLGIYPSVGNIWQTDLVYNGTLTMGTIHTLSALIGKWIIYDTRLEYYAAIVAKRY